MPAQPGPSKQLNLSKDIIGVWPSSVLVCAGTSCCWHLFTWPTWPYAAALGVGGCFNSLWGIDNMTKSRKPIRATQKKTANNEEAGFLQISILKFHFFLESPKKIKFPFLHKGHTSEKRTYFHKSRNNTTLRFTTLRFGFGTGCFKIYNNLSNIDIIKYQNIRACDWLHMYSVCRIRS